MKTGKQKIYWDSNIFLAWLKNEQQEPSVTDGIEEAIRKVRNNEIVRSKGYEPTRTGKGNSVGCHQ